MVYVHTKAVTYLGEVEEVSMTKTSAKKLAKSLNKLDFKVIEIRDCETHKVVSKYK